MMDAAGSMIVVHEEDPLVLTKKRSAAEESPGEPQKKKSRSAAKIDHIELQARRYQNDALEKAMSQNTIVFLGTGTGKTFIAAMLVMRLSERLIHEKRIAVFLAPTVALVEQQARVFEAHLSKLKLNVEVYHGEKDKDINTWNSRRWQEAVDSRHVLVMTPVVFLYALQCYSVRMDAIEVLIIDECHHARKSHPYASVMKQFYHPAAPAERPKILGLTASLVIEGRRKIEDQISALESLLDSRVYTVKADVEDLNASVTLQRTVYYEKAVNTFQSLDLVNVQKKYIEEHGLFTSEIHFGDEKKLEERMSKMLNRKRDAVHYCLMELGLWCALLATDAENCKSIKRGGSHLQPRDPTMDKHKVGFLQYMKSVIEAFMPEGTKIACDVPHDVKLGVERGYLTSKVEQLIVNLMKLKDRGNIRCIVFVDRVVTCLVLATLIKSLQCLDFLRVGFLTGVNNGKTTENQEESLEFFRHGKLNLLIATSVAEEGLDVEMCSCVFRFDLCRDLRSYVQSRGRARRIEAEYIVLLEKDNAEHEKLLLEMSKGEKTMNTEAACRISRNVPQEPVIDEDLEILELAPGVTMSSLSSIVFLQRYCDKLPGDRYYNPRPEFSYKQASQGYICTISFPPNAPLQHHTGHLKRNKQLAKRNACLQVCELLYKRGQLTLSSIQSLTNNDDEEAMICKDGSGSGTTKLKELYPSIKLCSTLQSSWIHSQEEVHLNLYKLSFSAQTEDVQELTNYAFLLEPRLDDEIANLQLPLPLRKDKVAKAELSFVESVTFTSEQVATAKLYQEIMFNGAYARLVFWPETEPRIHKRCILTEPETSRDLWSQVYVLLPLNKEGVIDWGVVSSTVAAGKIFQKLCVFPQPENESETEDTKMPTSTAAAEELETADGLVRISDLVGHVVLTIHTGKLFCVEEVLYGTNSYTYLNEKYKTYKNFFWTKYGRTLRFPEQDMLRVKPTHAVHNHLTLQLPKDAKSPEGPQDQTIELPAELCLVLESRPETIRSLYLIPSVMYRVSALILASEFRAKFTPDTPCAKVSEILAAFTSARCHEGFSYESLELLGDSILKFAVSQKIFLVNTNNHEGQLSGRRSRAICNATLRRIAVQSGLAAYIRDEPFYPNHWVGAGMFELRPRKCLCIRENLVTSVPKPTDLDFYLGKTCGEGHRWMCSKTSADVVESLIGAYFLGGGYRGAMQFMKKVGVDVSFDETLIDAVHESKVPLENIGECLPRLQALEEIIGYTFKNKALLLEAITHASQPGTTFCYQRLEFLGDAVLDVLITDYVYKKHPGLPPGTLSELRSAAVNNGCFARVAVRHGLHDFIRHDSGELQGQISEFLKVVRDSPEDSVTYGYKAETGPKVLGDMVESITGAVLLDTKFNLEEVWRIMKPLLSPIVTPEKLPLHPIRELQELCTFKYLPLRWNMYKDKESKGKETIWTAEVVVQTERRVVEQCQKKEKMAARINAALQMLRTLKGDGYLHPKWDSATERADWADAEYFHGIELMEPEEGEGTTGASGPSLVDINEAIQKSRKLKVLEGSPDPEKEKSVTELVSETEAASSIPAHLLLRGAARQHLNTVCDQKMWRRPSYKEDEQQNGKTKTFAAVMTIDIPEKGLVIQDGEYMQNKRIAKDDVAKKMILKLQSMGLMDF